MKVVMVMVDMHVLMWNVLLVGANVSIRDVEAIDRFHFGGWDSY